MYYYYRPEYNYMDPYSAEPVFAQGRYQDQIPYSENIEVYNDAYRNMRTGMEEALKTIREAVEGEKEDRDFYEMLVSMAPAQEDMGIINGIRQNEIHHNALFRELYYELTGKKLRPENIAQQTGTQSTGIGTYCEGLKKALMGEQKAVEKYRRILFAMSERKHINIMTEIITDELRHLGLYNYLYAKNGCNV